MREHRHPRRVMMSADTLGGVWRFALVLARELGERGVEVGLATLGRALNSDQGREAASIGTLTVFESSYRLEWMPDPWADWERAGEWLLETAAVFRPQVVHLNHLAHASLPWAAPVLVTGHSCVLSWWEHVHREKAPTDWHRYAKTVSTSLQAARLVVAPSQAMLQDLQFHYGPFKASRHIYNGLPEKSNAGEKQPFILAAGRIWDEAKNISLLSDVSAVLPWPVVIAGDGERPGGGRVDISGVKTLGHLSPAELQPWFERAAIYAFPAKYEPFGLSILEAAQCGCALVLGDIPSLREVWGEAAFYVDPNSQEALRRKVEQLVSDAPLRRRMGVAARERALRYTKERMAQGYLEAYGQVLNEEMSQNSQRGVGSLIACAS